MNRIWAARDLSEFSIRALEVARPAEDGDDWRRVDTALREAIERLHAQTGLEVVFVLADREVEDVGGIVYVHFEPIVNVVVSVGSNREISISADAWLWEPDSLRPTFEALTNHANDVLRERELPDALIDIARRACELMVEPPPPHDGRPASESHWTDRLTDRALDLHDQPPLLARLWERFVPASVRSVLAILALGLGSVIGLLLAVVAIDSWMTPPSSRPFEWGATGHALLLLAAAASIALCVRMAWKLINDLRGRPTAPLSSWLTNERAGWIMFFAGGVPLTIKLIFDFATTEWSTDVSVLVLLPLRVFDWFETIIFAVLFLLAPRIGRMMDRDESD